MAFFILPSENLELFPTDREEICIHSKEAFYEHLLAFKEWGSRTRIEESALERARSVPVLRNEFWTSKQRAASSLHEVSYRACFKPQLPRFFIQRLTDPGDTVYDPFMGRGTTLLEAALMGRQPIGCDINPLSKLLVKPRLNPPSYEEVRERLTKIPFTSRKDLPQELLVFYHPRTLRQICALKAYLKDKETHHAQDGIDDWIRMVATNRLTGHSKGFFSVYTLPPNQAVSIARQRKINQQRDQKPEVRDVPELILRKTHSLLSTLSSRERKNLENVHQKAILLTESSYQTFSLASESVSLIVTSPPFLDTVNYAYDNWLRCWFNEIDEKEIPIWILRKVKKWQNKMTLVLKELRRLLKPKGYIAFEVGEVRSGKIKLEEIVIPAGLKANLSPLLVLINDQKFTKTSNCWGVGNSEKGTNTNRIIPFQKN